MKNCVFLVLVSFSINVFSQIPFDYVLVDGRGPSDIWGKAVGDLNGDGLPDLIAGGNSSGGLVWYENPSWKKRTINSGNGFSTDHEVFDIDRDGDLDVFTIWGDSLVWFENGANWASHTIQSRTKLHDFEVSDFDGDGKVDVVGRDQAEFGHSGKTLFFYKQSSPAVWISSSLNIPNGEGLKVADINHDGRTDVVINSNWYENSGSISTWHRHTFTTGWTHRNAYIDVGDFNGDGRIDIVQSPSELSGQTYRVSWFEAPPDPTGENWTEHIIEADVETVHHFVGAADLDNDGDIDLASAEMTQGNDPDEVKVYINADDGQSWTKQVIATSGSHSMRIVDVDKDGDMDLYGANWNDKKVELWINRTDPSVHLSLDDWSYFQIDDSRPAPAFGLAMGDLNGDGQSDIVSGNYFYRNPGGDMNAPWDRITFPITVDALFVIDVDEDTYGDVIGMDPLGSLYWMEASDPQGNFWNSKQVGEVESANHGISTQGYVAAQLVPGGKPEIIVNMGSSQVNGPVYYFEIPSNPVNGDWQRTTIADSTYPEGIGVGDIDRDGDIDICGTLDATHVSWWENPGDGSSNWAMHMIGSTPSPIADRFSASDVNGDNQLDIVVSVANGDTNGVFWFEAPADPQSANWVRHTVVVQNTTNSLDVADMDEDGDMDIISAEHRGTKKLAVWENDGNGNFTEHVVSSGKESHLGAQVSDLDGDDDLDIVSIAWDDFQYLHLWRNDAGYKNLLKPKYYFPNFFNPKINIRVKIPEDGFVNLKIQNIDGVSIYTIMDQKMHRGFYTKMFNASKLSSGIYFLNVKVNNFQENIKFIYLN